jgi:hypothetical protein
MEKKNIYLKLLECKKQIGTVAKNAKNPHFKNTYADLNALIEAVEPILLEKGLVMLQPIRGGKQYTEIHDTESGESVESYLELNSTLPPQAQGSAITYFRRYTLQSLLSLKADDDDGQSASTAKPVKPTFTDANFAKAFEAGATVELIKQKYEISSEVEKQYLLYVKSNTK